MKKVAHLLSPFMTNCNNACIVFHFFPLPLTVGLLAKLCFCVIFSTASVLWVRCKSGVHHQASDIEC